jgi:hypothetical protein
MRRAATLKASMKHQRDANGTSNVGLGEAAQITALIIDLRRIDHLIEGDIAREEKEAGVFDLSGTAYPIMARIFTVRRNNLANTIATLEGRLAKVFSSSDRTKQSGPEDALCRGKPVLTLISVAPFQVPELTRSADIKLNTRVSLRANLDAIL